MRIPKSFKLAGLTITIEKDGNFVAKHGCLGQALYAEQKIIIDHEAAPEETTEQGVTHELVHWILYVMGETKLRNDEKFVDVFAHLLYQALDTAKYE